MIKNRALKQLRFRVLTYNPQEQPANTFPSLQTTSNYLYLVLPRVSPSFLWFPVGLIDLIIGKFYRSGMQRLRHLQIGIFQRMEALQRGSMQSQLAFVFFQILKLLFRDAFIVTLFAFPLPNTQDTLGGLFAGIRSVNGIVSVLLAVLLAGVIGLAAVRPPDLQQKFKSVLQVVVPWVDVTALLIITISLQLLSVNIGSNLWLLPFNLIAVIGASIITVAYSLFNFTKEPRSSNLLKRRQARMVTFCDLATLLICFYLASVYTPGGLSSQLGLIFSLIQLCLSLIKIKQRVFMQFYLGEFSQSVSNLFFFIELNLAFLAFACRVFQLAILSENLYLIMFIMTGLEYAAITAYIASRNSDMCLSSSAELKDEEQAGLYLDRLCEMITKVEKEEDDIILTSLKKKHSIACKKADCFCQSNPGAGDFMRNYVRGELQAMTELFHTSISILLSVLYFKMVVFKYYPEILGKLAYYSSHFTLSITQRYYRYALTQYVREFIRKRNVEIDAVDSEHMFKLEEIRSQIESIIRGEIEARNKLWKYLSRGLCRISELQHSCNLSLGQISRLMVIFNENKGTFKKSKEFNLLLLFYFVKVGFLNNGKDIKQNLKELYYGYKEDELYSLKQFKKFIYHKRSCVIETLVDTKTMGIVTGASRNVQDMFGIPQNKVIGTSINNLMPQFMGEQHQLVIAEWARSGTWRTIGRLKEIFCIHKDQFCFSALIYLKIYIKDNNMHFITSIFKLNDADFMVINPELKVEGLGKKFLKLLGEPAKRISLQLVIEHADGVLSLDNYPQGKIYRKPFISLKNMEGEVDKYFQNLNMKFDPKERQQITLEFHDRLQYICQERYLLEFTIRRCKMGKINYLVIGLKDSKHLEVEHDTCTLIHRPTPDKENSREMIDYSAEESDQSSFDQQDHDHLLMDHNASSSLASISQKENYPIAKTIQKFITLVQQPDRINDRRLSNFNLLMVIILILLSIIDFISYYCYKEMLLQIEGIFFADGAQSDVMQTTEIGYSYIYMLRSQLLANASQAEFDSTLRSARLVNSYVYSLRESDFASLITNVAELSKDRFYSYLEKPAKWAFQTRPTQVITHQFLENMYYLSTRVINELEALRAANSTQINTTFFKELFNNFPEMQGLNEYYLNDYQNTSMEQHDMLNYFTICSMVVYFFLSLVLSLALNHYFKFRFNQIAQSFAFFSFIANYYLQRMKEYYAMLLSSVVEGQKLKAIDTHEEQLFQIDTYDLFHKNDTTKGSLFSKIKFINYQNYYKWIFILILFCILNAINYLATAQIRNFFPDSRMVITEINQLIRSENKLLEAYFNLRAAYSLDANGYVNQTLYDSLIGYLNQTDTKFNNVADHLTTIFNNYDPTYETNFVNTLVTSVCQLSAADLTPFENSKCIKELTLNILDGGILIAMNYFQRNVRTALQDLRTYYITNTEQPPKGDYFRQVNFIQLDKMLIYMFKVFQKTQAISFNSYITTINIITSNYLKLTVGMTAFFILAMLVWLKSIPAQKRNLSYLYGHLLLIPFMILKSNSRIASTLKEAIEYSDI